MPLPAPLLEQPLEESELSPRIMFEPMGIGSPPMPIMGGIIGGPIMPMPIPIACMPICIPICMPMPKIPWA